MEKNDFTLDIYLDDEFKLQKNIRSKATIKDVKSMILNSLQLYSINYQIKYNDRDYSNLDDFKLSELFLIKREVYDLHLISLTRLIKGN